MSQSQNQNDPVSKAVRAVSVIALGAFSVLKLGTSTPETLIATVSIVTVAGAYVVAIVVAALRK